MSTDEGKFDWLTRRLDAAAQAQAEELEQAEEVGAGSEDAAFLDRVDALATEEPLDRPSDQRRHEPRSWARWLPAAAGVLLLGLAGRSLLGPEPGEHGRGPEPLDSMTMGDSGDWVLVAPAGSAAEFARFEWRFEGETPAASYRVLVFDAENSEDTPLDSRLVTGTVWSPSVADRESWPEKIEWVVEALDGSQVVRAVSPAQRASRSR